jgi:hypothetical protein
MQVTITIKTTQAKFPGGTVGGNWRIELLLASDGSLDKEYEGPTPSANFDLVESTVYNLRGYRLDAGGAMLGPVATDQYTVGEDLVPLDIANTISAVSTPARGTPMVGGHRR